MAVIFHVREGAPPDNITFQSEVDVGFIQEKFGNSLSRYKYSQLSGDHPVVNGEDGPANPYSEPRHVVVRIAEEELGALFPKPGFYLVKDTSPKPM